MQTRLKIALCSLALAMPLSGSFALAAGGGGDSVPECKKGEVYDKKTQKCVKQNADGSIDDDSIYSTAASWRSRAAMRRRSRCSASRPTRTIPRSSTTSVIRTASSAA